MKKFKKFTDKELKTIRESLGMMLFKIMTDPLVHNREDMNFLVKTKKVAKKLSKQITKEMQCRTEEK